MNTRTLTPRQRGWIAGLSVWLILVSVACVAVISYYITSEVKQGIFTPSHFFGYFTVHMGLLFPAVYIAYAALRPWQATLSERRARWIHRLGIVQNCLAIYGLIILVVYWLIVSSPSEWKLDGWIVIHLVMPLTAIIAWLATVRDGHLWWASIPVGYILLYAAWTFAHGLTASDHWFPYDFMDIVTYGLTTPTLVRICAILAGVVIVSFAFTAIVTRKTTHR